MQRIALIVFLFFAGTICGMGQVSSLFSTPNVAHVSYHYNIPATPTSTVYRLLLRNDGGDTVLREAYPPGSFSGRHRTDLTGGAVQFIIESEDALGTKKELLLGTVAPTNSISGRAVFDEPGLSVPSGTVSVGFQVSEGVTVVLDASTVDWAATATFGRHGIGGSIELKDGVFNDLAVDDIRELTLTRCLVRGKALIEADVIWLDGCLFNNRQIAANWVEVRVGEQLDIRGTESVPALLVRPGLGAALTLSNNTFYGNVSFLNTDAGTIIMFRHNTLFGGVSLTGAGALDQNHNYRLGWGSARLGANGGWLSPWVYSTSITYSDTGDIERAPLAAPRNLPPLRPGRLEVAIGQEVMRRQSGTANHEYETFVGHVRADLPLAFSFDLRPFSETLPGVAYVLEFNGQSYAPQGTYVARAGREHISAGYGNAGNTLNFIVPTTPPPGEYEWMLRADYSGLTANIVPPDPIEQRVASGRVTVQPAFARPLRVGVMEVHLKVGYELEDLLRGSREGAVERIRNDLIMLLPLLKSEVEVVDLGVHEFHGGWVSSWWSGTASGRANQISAELEVFVGQYNAHSDPLDFLVGVVPLGSLGGAEGVSMALRRRAILVDETSPEAALHEIGHSMGLYLNTEQYKLPHSSTQAGILWPGRGLYIGGQSAFNVAGIANEEVPAGQIQHFPSHSFTIAYDVMGAVSPMWIAAGTHWHMKTWLTNNLGLVDQAEALAASFSSGAARSGTRTVHMAALITRTGTAAGDRMTTPSIRIEEVPRTVDFPNAHYNLNYRFEAYDDTGVRLTQIQCKTMVSSIATNTLWQQTFTVPAQAARYAIIRTPTPAEPTTYTEVWSREALPVLDNEMHMAYDAGTQAYEITFQSSGHRRDVVDWLLFSRNNGATWEPLPLSPFIDWVRLPRSALPGDHLQFRLASSDGFQTALSDVFATGAVPPPPPLVRVLDPRDGQQAPTDHLWTLSAEAVAARAAPTAIHWTSNRDGHLGDGATLSAVLLSPGDHVLEAVAVDTGGLTATATVRVTIGDLDRVDLALTETDVRLTSEANAGDVNRIAYGATQQLEVTIRNQGFANTVDVQVFLTPPDGEETVLLDATWPMQPFEVRVATMDFSAPTRGDYRVRARCEPLDLPDSNMANNEVVVIYGNHPPLVFNNRFSVMLEDLPLEIPLFAWDPNGDPVTFEVVSPANTELQGGNTVVFTTDTPGTYSIEYKAADEDIASSVAVLTIDVYGDDPDPGPGPSSWDEGYQAMGDGWRLSPWFGWYRPMGDDGWIWHLVHGYYYVAPSSRPNSIFLYSLDMGWLWTSRETWSWFYRFSDVAWIWYDPATSYPRRFFNASRGFWEQEMDGSYEDPFPMARIPAGTFAMGDTFNEGGVEEQPVHEATLDAFHMSETLVTKAQWDEVHDWAVNNGYTFQWTARGKAPDHPVYWISWHDMLAWCNAKSRWAGLTPVYLVPTGAGQEEYMGGFRNDVIANWGANGYRLPTEAEWEYAARGGLAGQRYPDGNTISHAGANYLGPSGDFHPDHAGGAQPHTSPVHAFPSNGYGLYDMAGNLFQWCWNWYGPYTADAKVNPRGPDTGPGRVIRGGAWSHAAVFSRVAYRHHKEAGSVGDYVGFRIVRRAG